MSDDKLVYYGSLTATGDYRRMAELLHLWRWSGIIKEELIELQTGLDGCLREIENQLKGG